MSGSVGDRPHPVRALDDVVHQKTRLGVLAVLREADRVDFSYLRDVLGLTDGNLSRHLRTLEEAGYVHVHKGYEGRRPRTWLSLTRAGARALAEEVAVLRTIVARMDGTGQLPGGHAEDSKRTAAAPSARGAEGD